MCARKFQRELRDCSTRCDFYVAEYISKDSFLRELRISRLAGEEIGREGFISSLMLIGGVTRTPSRGAFYILCKQSDQDIIPTVVVTIL